MKTETSPASLSKNTARIQNAVTIVVPVFNQWEVLKECIAALKEHTDSRHKILIIDDASPEEGIEERVRDALCGMQNASYVRNEKNLGFVGTCNRVCELDTSQNDVLLLNSDAMLTEGCLEEMLRCLHANEHHGACCPRSNAATIYSIGRKNTDMQEAFDCWTKTKEHLPQYTQMPTGHGFCMLIRRELIERFGLFDPIYGRGYNEENDFCMRIGRYGFRAVAANHAFAFHKDKASFGSERSVQEHYNRAILDRRYPEYEDVLLEDHWNVSGVEHFLMQLGTQHESHIAIDLSRLPPRWNGTSMYALNILPTLVSAITPKANVTIVTSAATDAFFGLSQRYNVLVVNEDEIDTRFDLVFVPQQVFDLAHLSFINRLAPRWVITIHDIIANRCTHLQNADTEMCTNIVLQFALQAITVSQSSREDIACLFGQVTAVDVSVIHHGYDENLTVVERSSLTPSGEYDLVIGNHFDHKAMQQTLNALPKDHCAIVVGAKRTHALFRKNITALTSGELDETQMQSLYAHCRTVIFPSQYEGFGLPLLHAAKYCKPVIAFDTAATREVVEAFSLEGVTYVDSFEQLADCITAATETHIPPPAIKRTWKDSAQETEKILARALATPIDTTALNERFRTVNSLMKLRSRYDELRRRTRPLPLRLLHRTVACLLTPFPRWKSRVHTFTYNIGLS